MNDFLMMQGAWDVKSLEQDGKPAPDAPLVKLIIFKDDHMWFRYVLPRSNEFGDEPAQFELDPTQKPKRIDQTVDGKRYLGIYDLEGDTLGLCWRRTPNMTPPLDFFHAP